MHAGLVVRQGNSREVNLVFLSCQNSLWVSSLKGLGGGYGTQTAPAAAQ